MTTTLADRSSRQRGARVLLGRRAGNLSARGALLAMAGLTLAGALRAAPELAVSADGDCPSQVEIETALAARGFVIGQAKYLVKTQTQSTGILLQLLRPQGNRVLKRQLDSTDCHALADAIAVVVEAYFVEVKGPRAAANASRDETPATSAEQDNKNASVADDRPLRHDAPQPTDGQLAAGSAPTPGAMGAITPPPTNEQPGAPKAWTAKPTTQKLLNANSAPERVTPWVADGFAGVGPVVAMPEGSLQPQFELGGGVEHPSVPLSTELQLATSLPTATGGTPNRVHHWASHALLRLGMPLHRRLRYRPWVGVGIASEQLRAMDVPAAPTKTSMPALVGGGFELAWPMGGSWLGRVDAGCLVLTTRNAYVVQPDGVIGHGPRVVCSLMLGVGLGSLHER